MLVLALDTSTPEVTAGVVALRSPHELIAALAGQEIGDEALAFLGHLRHLPRQLDRVGRRRCTRRLGARGAAPPRQWVAGTCSALCIAHPKILTRHGRIKCSDGRSGI